MKIGLIIEHVDPRRGGAETSTNQFINRWQKSGSRRKSVNNSFPRTAFARSIGVIVPRTERTNDPS